MKLAAFNYRMNIGMFQCPPTVKPCRWNAMKLWYFKRLELGEDVRW